jgi:TRAP-type C4-dicarboxylate transport system permease small subunit
MFIKNHVGAALAANKVNDISMTFTVNKLSNNKRFSLRLRASAVNI